MKFNFNIKTVKHILDTNSPVILTGIAVSGAALTAYLSVKAGMKSSDALRTKAENESRGDGFGNYESGEFTNAEMFLETYKFYIPAAASLVGTSVCMVMATKIGLDRTAALAGTLIVAERANDQYRDKVKEILGENKHVKVQDAVAKDAVERTSVPTHMIGLDDQLFLDMWTGRYFPSTREKVEAAVNEFNHRMLTRSTYGSLNSFYESVGLDDIQSGSEMGWHRDALLELTFTPVLKDGKAVVAFQFDRKPMSTFRDGDI